MIMTSIEETSAVFVNSDSNKMYDLEYIDTEEDVRIFSVKEVDPFQVITMIKFTTHPLWGISQQLEKDMSIKKE